MKVRALGPGDLDAVLAIQSSCPEAAQWSGSDYERAAGGGFQVWVAEGSPGVSGFLVARRAADEMEILNLAVHPDVRRAGIGSHLLTESLEWGRRGGARRAFLEVRASNGPAIAFYQRHGFRSAGRRPRYYSAPIEDAVLLRAALN